MSVLTPSQRYVFRKIRTRRKIFGTAERPRFTVCKTSKHMYGQLVDDSRGRTLAAVSTLDPALRQAGVKGATVAAAQSLGKLLAEKAKAAGIENVVFDRGGRRYHGRIKAVADGAREAGLKF